MIPTYQQLMRPLLEIASNRDEIQLREAIDKLADQYQLSPQEREERLPSGKQSIFDNRVGWAKTYLVKAGLLESSRRAYFSITERGRQSLADNNATINAAYLKQFDEFNAFVAPKNDANLAANPVSEASQDDNLMADDITPDETLRAAYKQINHSLADDILTRTRQVSPAFFEQLLIDLLIAMGYSGSNESMGHTLGQTGDNGVDGVINQDPLGVDQIYIQAKRYAQGNNVGSGEIRDFFGALNLKKAQKGIFITTADFTASATQTAKDLGIRIVLINGKQLATLMLKYNIGCREEEALYLKKIDEEFFDN